MGILLRKHRGAFAFTGMAKLSFVLFFSSLASALTDTIWAVYLKDFLSSDAIVGFFSGFLSVLAFVSFFMIVPLIEKSKKSALYSIALILMALLYFAFSINRNLIVFVILGIIITVMATIKLTVFGIIVRDKSDKKKVSENEGLIYSFNNVAWVVGPLIAGLILIDFGISFIFISSSFLLLLAFFLFRMSGVKDSNIVKKTHKNVLENFFEFFKNRDRVISYVIGAGVTFWWVLVYLYTPLFMMENGLKASSIGIFLFAAALPLIILEYPFSKFAERHGAKRFFILGYLIVIIASLLAFLFVNSVYLVLGFLIFGSVGMAMLEPTTEAYFFDVIKNKEEENRFYGPYNTAIEVGLVFGKIAPAVLLLFLPFKYIFVLFAAILFGLFLLSFKAKNIVEGRRR